MQELVAMRDSSSCLGTFGCCAATTAYHRYTHESTLHETNQFPLLVVVVCVCSCGFPVQVRTFSLQESIGDSLELRLDPTRLTVMGLVDDCSGVAGHAHTYNIDM